MLGVVRQDIQDLIQEIQGGPSEVGRFRWLIRDLIMHLSVLDYGLGENWELELDLRERDNGRVE